MRLASLAAAAAVAAALAGCGAEQIGPRASDTAQLRLASASPDAGALDLLVNGRTVARGVGSTAASTPTAVESGRATGVVRATGTAAALASVPLTLEAGKSYTVLAAGPRGSLTAMVSVDTGASPPVSGPSAGPTPPPADTVFPSEPFPDAARFRIVHAAPHAPALDPYLIPSGAPLDTLPTLQPFAYGSLALTAELIRSPGHYTVEFTDAGTTHVVLTSGDIDATAGSAITVVLGESADESLRVDVVRE
jgi:hypothetical protein